VSVPNESAKGDPPRTAVPADVGPAVAFLASEEEHWTNGQMLTAVGGHTRN
jgi:NAD(P)-dependent dehydrogenase (short-subunit alcohol dehydrogenase family)